VLNSYGARNRARATKIIINGTDVDYAESGSENRDDDYTGPDGIKGRAERKEYFRVRAFYKLPR
ncbi:hypothetical protein, partial [uncultured Muribaculum sp.]